MKPHLRVHDVEVRDKGGFPIVVGPHASVDVGSRHRVEARVTNEHASRAAWVRLIRVELFDEPDATEPGQWLEHSWISELRDIKPGEEVKFQVDLGLTSERMHHCRVRILDASDSPYW